MGLFDRQEKKHLAVQIAERSRPACERVEDRSRLVAFAATREVGGLSGGSVDRRLVPRRATPCRSA